MGYKEALEAAGAKVHAFEEFGSYQGDWWAKVTYQDNTGWIRGSYGSCSGCDAFEAEFGWRDRGRCEEHEWDSDEERKNCEACEVKKKEFDIRFSKFGAEYLDGIKTQENAEAVASENLDWDCDAEKMVKFIKDNA